VYGIDIDSGKKLWEFKLDTGVFASPILVNDTLYIPTIDGSLYAFK
jgi:outer membrane protein assembly factor BamB